MKKPKASPELKLKNFLSQWKKAGLSGDMLILKKFANAEEYLQDEKDGLTLQQKADRLLGFINSAYKQPLKVEGMLFWVMYDITENKVRNQIVKYLKKKGCIRMQKSVFVGNLPSREYQDIVKTLREVNELYENNDSIMIAPIDIDQLRGLHLIGRQQSLHLFLETKSTLFF